MLHRYQTVLSVTLHRDTVMRMVYTRRSVVEFIWTVHTCYMDSVEALLWSRVFEICLV